MAARVRSGKGMTRAIPDRSASLHARAMRRALCVLGTGWLVACGGASSAGEEAPVTAATGGPGESGSAVACAGPLEAPEILPRVDPAELSLEHWLARAEASHVDLDAVLLDASEIAAHDAAVGSGAGNSKRASIAASAWTSPASTCAPEVSRSRR